MVDWKNKTDNKASNTVVSKRNIDKGEVRSEKIEKMKKAEKISQSEHVNLVHKKDYMMPNSHIWFDKKGVDRMDRGCLQQEQQIPTSGGQGRKPHGRKERRNDGNCLRSREGRSPKTQRR